MAKESGSSRRSRHDGSKPHITETPLTKANWYKHVNWVNCLFIIGLPMIGLIMSIWTPLRLPTAIWAVAYYFMTGLGITAG
jgi:stearoyl-CoA desaturase (delta-9 desaturase)